ncbi:MAG: type II secretion system F family protein [Actinobacteria bacterium]|nr:type II secretion system F family protein [Actinomycetota bacterium]
MKPSEIDMLSIAQAGLSERLKPRTLPTLRWCCASIVAIIGSLLCLPISGFLAFSAFLVGGFIGHRWPVYVLKRTAEHRRNVCEHGLPAMIDIVALCIRAGASFDSSVETYCERFDSLLAHECMRVYREYSQGLASRDDTWRRLAVELEIASFSRFVETTLQAIHFGAPLASVLLELSSDIRKEYKARTTERVAKAPVKMLIPTGVLILPAMLLLVMGPVVLNLTNEMM